MTAEPRCRRCGQPDYEPLCPSCEADREDALGKIAAAIVDGRLVGLIHGDPR